MKSQNMEKTEGEMLVEQLETFLDECEKQLPYNEYLDITNELKDVVESRLKELKNQNNER